ncbi:MAG: helix-turn-helix domain-containing protein [Pseudonocardia sp.]
MGRVLRAYRMSSYHRAVHGLSQSLLGQWLSLTQSQISRIETGPPVLSLDTLRHWARVLRIPQEWLWFDLDLSDRCRKIFRSPDETDDEVDDTVVSASSSDAAPTAASRVLLDGSPGGRLGAHLWLPRADGDEPVERRGFVQAAALVGLGVAGSAAGLEIVRHELNDSLADERGTASVDEWQAIALDYDQAYLTTAPAVLLPALLVDLQGLRLAMQRQPGERARRELVRVGASLADYTAQTVSDLGDLVEARRWWRSARRAADETSDLYTVFRIRSDEVVRACYERRPIRESLQLVAASEARLDGAPPAVLPGFWAGKAQTLAIAGRHGEAEQALDRVRECSVGVPPSMGHSDSLRDWTEVNVRYTESFVYSHAGKFAEAEQAQQAALSLYVHSYDHLRGPAGIELQRALCLVRSGDVALGVGHAQAVITDLPAMYHDRVIADLGQKVFGAIPVHDRHHSWAQEYREFLQSSLPGVGAGNALAGTTRA